MPGMGHGTMGGMMGMVDMEVDLDDYDWDAYLANDQTLLDPELVQGERGGRVRLQVINAASATVFWIDTGNPAGRVVGLTAMVSSRLPATASALQWDNGSTSRSIFRTTPRLPGSGSARRRARTDWNPSEASTARSQPHPASGNRYDDGTCRYRDRPIVRLS